MICYNLHHAKIYDTLGVIEEKEPETKINNNIKLYYASINKTSELNYDSAKIENTKTDNYVQPGQLLLHLIKSVKKSSVTISRMEIK